MKPKAIPGLLCVLLLCACTKSPKVVDTTTGSTFSFKFHEHQSGHEVTITNANCPNIQAQSIVSSGQTAITILGWYGAVGAQADIDVNFALQAGGVGIYSQHPVAVMDGECISLASNGAFESTDEKNISVELTRFDGVGGYIGGTVNATLFHTIDPYVPDTQSVDITGSFNIKRTY